MLQVDTVDQQRNPPPADDSHRDQPHPKGGKPEAGALKHQPGPQQAWSPPARRLSWAGTPVLGLALAVMAGLLAVVCGGNEGPPAGPTSSGGRLEVVTTIEILADLARNVGGDRVKVRSLVPAGVDVHSFQTTPEDSIAVSRAGVIVVNGLGLDAVLEPVIQSAKRADAVLVTASAGLKAEPAPERGIPGEERTDNLHEEQEHPEGDPHLWQDPLQTIHYVEQIQDGLTRADPANAATYQANATAYIQQLRELDQEVRKILSEVPLQRRHLVTFHDAFGYFARRYGWQLSAFVGAAGGDVTPGQVVKVMELVKADGIPAIFTEPQFQPDVMQQAAKDAGVTVGTIYSDALDKKVPTYIDMMRFNARSLAEQLR